MIKFKNSDGLYCARVSKQEYSITNHFIFYSDLSSDINRFEITLSNKTKKSKDPDICKYYKSSSISSLHISYLVET